MALGKRNSGATILVSYDIVIRRHIVITCYHGNSFVDQADLCHNDQCLGEQRVLRKLTCHCLVTQVLSKKLTIPKIGAAPSDIPEHFLCFLSIFSFYHSQKATYVTIHHAEMDINPTTEATIRLCSLGARI